MVTSTGDYVSVHLRLAGARQFQAEAASASRAVSGIGSAAKVTGASVRGAASEVDVFGFNTVRMAGRVGRTMAWVTGIVGAGAIAMGIKFNATMESQTVAFEQFLGSTKAARKELDILFKVAQNTPFSFADVTSAGRKFLAFGFDVKQTNEMLNTIGDTVAGIGGGHDEINRAVIAIGQMKAKGRVMGQELLQLAELGIPSYQILADELNLTSEQVRMIGEQGIDSEIAINALMKGMDKMFKGAAANQSKTLFGQWEKLKDTTAQGLGFMLRPLTEHLRTELFPLLNNAGTAVTNAIQKGGGYREAAQALDRVFDSGTAVQDLFREIGDTVQALQHLWSDTLMPAFRDMKPLLFLLLTPLWLFNEALKIAGEHTTMTRIALDILLPLYVAWKLALIGTNTVLKIQAAYLAWTTGATSAHTVALTASTAAQWLMSGATRAMTVSMVSLNMAMWANPVGLIVLGIIALTAVLVTLYYKWDWFHDIVNDTFQFFVNNWPMVAGLIFGPIAVAADLMIGKWDDVFDAFKATVEKIKEIWNSLDLSLKADGDSKKFRLLGAALNTVAPGAGTGLSMLPAMASGGNVHGAGWSLVGEKGPELRYMPAGASVRPLSRGPRVRQDMVKAIDFGGGGGMVTVQNNQPILIDGKKVGEVIGTHYGDEVARR